MIQHPCTCADKSIDLELVEEAVGRVQDPCGLIYGTALSFAEMGMVESIESSGSTVTLRLLLDDPNCLYMPRIAGELEREVLAVEGVEEVVIKNRGDLIWTEERMTAQGRQKLLDYRARKRTILLESKSANGPRRNRADEVSPEAGSGHQVSANVQTPRREQ